MKASSSSNLEPSMIIEGFICPECQQDLSSIELLQAHFELFHSKKGGGGGKKNSNLSDATNGGDSSNKSGLSCNLWSLVVVYIASKVNYNMRVCGCVKPSWPRPKHSLPLTSKMKSVGESSSNNLRLATTHKCRRHNRPLNYRRNNTNNNKRQRPFPINSWSSSSTRINEKACGWTTRPILKSLGIIQ